MKQIIIFYDNEQLKEALLEYFCEKKRHLIDSLIKVYFRKLSKAVDTTPKNFEFEEVD